MKLGNTPILDVTQYNGLHQKMKKRFQKTQITFVGAVSIWTVASCSTLRLSRTDILG